MSDKSEIQKSAWWRIYDAIELLYNEDIQESYVEVKKRKQLIVYQNKRILNFSSWLLGNTPKFKAQILISNILFQ